MRVMFRLPGHRRRAALRLLQYDVDTLRKANVELTKRIAELETLHNQLYELVAMLEIRFSGKADQLYKLFDISILNASRPRHAKVRAKKSQGTRKK